MEHFPVKKFSKEFLMLVAMLLAFVLLLVGIWLWYDLGLASLEQQKNHSQTSSHTIP